MDHPLQREGTWAESHMVVWETSSWEVVEGWHRSSQVPDPFSSWADAGDLARTVLDIQLVWEDQVRAHFAGHC